MEGDYIIEEAQKALPPYFYGFLKINLKTKSEFLPQKIVNTNIKKILKGKSGLTYRDILQRLLKEFREYIKYFLPKNVEKLPLTNHRTIKLKLYPESRPYIIKTDYSYLLNLVI